LSSLFFPMLQFYSVRCIFTVRCILRYVSWPMKIPAMEISSNFPLVNLSVPAWTGATVVTIHSYSSQVKKDEEAGVCILHWHSWMQGTFHHCRSNRNESSVAGSVTILASASICSSSISSGSRPSFSASSAVNKSVLASNESPRYDNGLMPPDVKSCCAATSPGVEHATKTQQQIIDTDWLNKVFTSHSTHRNLCILSSTVLFQYKWRKKHS